MFSTLCRRSVTPGCKDEEIRGLFDLWLDHRCVRHDAESRALVARMPYLLREREREREPLRAGPTGQLGTN